MDIQVEKKGNIHIFKLIGNVLSEAHTGNVLEMVNEALKQGCTSFVFDLSELKFMNSSGLGMMLTILTKARKAGGDVALTNISDQLKNLLIMTKLSNIFTTASSQEEAIAILSN